MLLVDDYTRMVAVCFLKNKLEAFENFKIYKEMAENEMDSNTLCKHCQQGKKTNTRFKSKEYSMIRPLKIVHTNLVGPTTTKVLKREKYFILLVDDYTGMTVVCFPKNKSKDFENFKIYKEMVEN
jgi:hypothetical protein